MITAASLILLSAIGIAALFLVSLVNRRQAKARQARQRVKMLKFRFDSLDELASVIDSLVDNRAISRRIYDEALKMLDAMQRLDPTASHIQASVAHAQRRAVELADNASSRVINRLRESDGQIAKAQQSLAEAGRILKQQFNRGDIAETEYDNYIAELRWLHLFVEVISLTGRGMISMQRDDVMGAFSFYKRAQACLLQSENRDERRTRLIKELNEMIGKKRSSLSPDLMPEAKHLLHKLDELNTNVPHSTPEQTQSPVEEDLLPLDEPSSTPSRGSEPL
ncbi:hypothetical protein NBRC116494_15060 [Aurantivibrio plasticivorans]